MTAPDPSPNSDRIAMIVETSNCASWNREWMAVWDGSAWGTRSAGAIQPIDYTAPNVSVAWEGTSGTALAVFGDSLSTANVKYKTWSGGSGRRLPMALRCRAAHRTR